jgi:hypothetical protein
MTESTSLSSSEATGRDEPCYPSYGLLEPWQEDRSEVPATDSHTTALIDQAVHALVLIRAPFEFDVLPSISSLVSIAAEVESHLPDAVADARDYGYSWDAIATRLATTTATARRRYTAYVKWRNSAADVSTRQDPPTP